MRVATLLEAGLEGLGAAVREFETETDAFEIRFDALKSPVRASEVRALTSRPLIATVRTGREGGQWKGSAEERARILREAVDAGFEYVDAETGDAAVPAKMIRSVHYREHPPTPAELLSYGREHGTPDTIAKLAAPTPSFEDVLNFLGATRRLSVEGHASALMGLGPYPRALAHLLGCALTYGGARANAPGQPPLRDVNAQLHHWGDPHPADRLYLVVGSPIAHSLSPRLHNAAFQQARMGAAYGALDVADAASLKLLLERSRGLALEGMSVTAPLKEAAFALVEERTPEAERARSVNTIRFENGKTMGHNTDGLGAKRVLHRLLNENGKSGRILLVGSGGAARGLLSQLPADQVTLAARDAGKRESLVREFGVAQLPPEVARGSLSDFAVVVNASSIEEPFRLDGSPGAVFDLHYAAGPTVWERAAKTAGLPFAGGRDLLLEQATFAFEFWTKRTAPRAVMAAALEANA